MDLDALTIDRDRARRRTRARWLRRGVPLLLLLALGLAFRAPLTEAMAGLGASEVRLGTVERVDPRALGALSGAAANGYVVAARRAALSADTPGRIVELEVTEGSLVSEGDLVARLFSDEFSAALARARADQAVARAGLAAAEQDVLRARAELALAETDVPRLEQVAAASRSDVEAAAARERLAELDVTRAEQLVTDRVSPQRDLDAARAGADEARAASAGARALAAAADGAVANARVQVEVRRAAVAQAEAAVVTSAARVDSAVAATALAEATLGKTEVRAPFDGVVVLKDAEVGEVVSPNSQGGSNARGSVATMVDRASLEVQAEVPETTLSAVRVGGQARIFLDAFPETPYEGAVDRIWPTADRQKATIEVRVRFDAPDDQLRPEMGVRVVFLDDEDVSALEAVERGEEPPLLLPVGSLVEREGRSGVFQVRDGRAVFRAVRTEGERLGRAVLIEGLAEGDSVVADAPPGLTDGDPVAVASEAASG